MAAFRSLILVSVIAVLGMLAVACGSESDDVQSQQDDTTADDTDSITPDDAMADDDETKQGDAMMDMDGHGFGATFVLNGESYSAWCPEGGSTPPFFGAAILANALRLTCGLEHEIGLEGIGVLLIISDVRPLDGNFELTGPGAGPQGPVVRGFEVSVGNVSDTVDRLWTRNMNVESADVSGTYNRSSGRVIGTFEGEFRASTRNGEGEGTLSGTFDLAIP